MIYAHLEKSVSALYAGWFSAIRFSLSPLSLLNMIWILLHTLFKQTTFISATMVCLMANCVLAGCLLPANIFLIVTCDRNYCVTLWRSFWHSFIIKSSIHVFSEQQQNRRHVSLLGSMSQTCSKMFAFIVGIYRLELRAGQLRRHKKLFALNE